MRIVPFEPAHLLRIDFGEYERMLFAGIDIEQLLATWPTGGAYSISNGEWIVGSAGVYAEGKRGICWAVLSDEARRHPAFLLRTARRYIDDLARGLDVVVLAIPEDYPGADRWARALGFAFNCVRPSDGTDSRPHLEYVKWPQAQSLQ
jgi:hypothetical protein